MLRLFDALPHEQCDRDAEGRSFSAGVYSRVKVSLRKACNLFPKTVCVVNRFVAALLPEAVYTSFAIFDRVQTREHRDSHNAFLPNYVIPLSTFRGGSVQVSEPGKQIELAVAQGPIQFCARHHEHRTLPFQGRRVVLVLFTLQQAGRLSGPDAKVLENLGFPLPSPALLASTDVCASKPIPVAAHLRRVLPPGCTSSPRADASSQPASPAVAPRQSPSNSAEPDSSPSSATASEGCNPLPPQGPSLVPRPPLMVDCLANAGAVAAAALQVGWDAVPLGRRRGALEGSPLVPVDLTAPEDLQSLLNYDHSSVVDWWHFNLFFKSCTQSPASRGRQVLRSADHILGRAPADDSAAALVQRDNSLCQAVVEILFRAYETQALVTLLGPARSWCWGLIAHFVKKRSHKAFLDWYFALADQELDTCMFGAPFLTSLRVRAAPASFGGLSRACDKAHDHRPWLPCAGAANFDDASLPPDLCHALCHSASQACSGLKPHKPDAVRSRRLRAQVRASAANQPAYMPPLIPEFRVRLPLSQVPPGADYKILSRGPGSKTGDDVEPNPSKKARLQGNGEGGDLAGVYFSMEEHLHRACQLASPADTSTRLPDAVRRNIFAILTEGPVVVSRKRMLELKSLNVRMAALASTEKELRAKMHPVVEQVTRGKAIALFRELLEETGFPDMSVVELLTEGVPLVGQETESPLFAKRPKPKDLEPDQLKAQAILRRRALQRMKGLTSEQDYKALKDETAEEVAAGFLSGPYHSEQEVSDILKTEGWSLSPRFLLRQGEDSKIRIIDDFKMSAVNRAFGSSSFLELQDTDYAVGLLRFLSRVLQDRSRVRVPLLDGSVLEGDWNSQMLRQPALLGKTLDLSKAYRQLGIHPSTCEHAVLGFPSPEGDWEFYLARSLPFGAAASVYGFNKVALAILHIMIVKFGAIATDFYDDYTLYEFRPAAVLLDKVLMRLLDLLGWAYAKSGRKFVPFDERVVSLGVSLNLDEIWSGTLTVENKAGRLEKIASLLRQIAEGGAVTRSDVASLHGLINFAGGLIMGFELKPTSRMLSRALSGPFLGNTAELKQACALALDVIAQCRPKRCPASILPPVVLYTDGAFEKNRGTWGAVVVDPCSGSRWILGGEVCQQLMDHWSREAGSQVICQIEAYALAITLFGVRGLLKGRSVLAWIDNNACLYGFVKRYSPSTSLLRLISLVALMESSMEALLWFERVPSKSNPADLPSRSLMDEACSRFGAADKGDVAVTSTMMDFIVAQHYEPRFARAILESTRLEADWAMGALPEL